MPGQHSYLRALATRNPFKKPANLWRDFPALANDFTIPDALKQQMEWTGSIESIHSAVLRISGDVAIWLHYDVMSNFWFQIQGTKKVLLFPPEDVAGERLKFELGDTVSSIDVEALETLAKEPAKVKQYAGGRAEINGCCQVSDSRLQ